MRILHVAPTYLPAMRYGGPIFSVHGLARAQSKRGDKVEIYTTNIDGPGVSDVPLGRPVDIDGVRVRYFPCGAGRRIYRSPDMARALEREVADVDILHLHAAFLWPTLAASRIASKRGVPYVFAPRGMLEPGLVRAKSRFAKMLWIEFFERKTIVEAATLHVTSAAERDGVMRLGLAAQRFAVIPNGVDLPVIDKRATSGRPIILCIGRLSWKKGLDRLIRAFSYTKDAELIIAGNDDEGLTPMLTRLASELGLGERVKIRGPAYGDDKSGLLQAASIFALASHSENFGNVVLEALAHAVPVVVTPEVGLSDTVRASGAGIVADGDPESFGRALGELLADPDRRDAMGAAGRRAAEDRFSWAHVAEVMDEVYKGLYGA